MKFTIILTIVIALTIVNPRICQSYRILGLFPVSARSHFMMFEALMKGLVRKGHQVDVISTYPLKTQYPNYTDIVVLSSHLNGLPRMVNSVSYDSFIEMSSRTIHFVSTEAGNAVCEKLGHPDILQLIRNPPRDPPYDVVIAEFFSTQCFLAVGHLLKIPTIGVSSTPLYPWLNSIIANPANLAFVPNNIIGYVAPMNFWQRFHNTIYAVWAELYFRYLTREQNAITRKYLGESVPEIQEMESNLGLVLMNSHVSVNGGRPMTSTLIEVGGLHIQESDANLSKELEQWMDSSEDGFVYFTFGSMVMIETFPKPIIHAFYESLRKIAPVRVLVKITDPKKLPPGLPKNIRTFQWVPQMKVLKHRNAKAFITHGGLMGTQEAIYYGVPMIGIPLFIDQFPNVELYVKRKIAVKLNHRTITEETLDHALKEILYNPIYKKSMLKVSEQFRDRPMSAMDTATWWIEYIARNGNKVLRSPAVDLAWWQIDLIDVYLFILLITALVIFLAITLARYVIKICLRIIRPKITSTKKHD